MGSAGGLQLCEVAGPTCAAVHHRRPSFLCLELLHRTHQVTQGLRGGGNAMIWPGMVVKVRHLAWRPCAGMRDCDYVCYVSSKLSFYKNIATCSQSIHVRA